MQPPRPARYHLVVKNRPGELAKLTKLLSDAGMYVSGLRIANLGDKASIQFATPGKGGRSRVFRRAGVRLVPK